MNNNAKRQIEVYADWLDLGKPTLMGIWYTTPSRGKEIFSFEYNHQWLANNQAYELDPSFQLYPGQQYAPSGKVSLVFFWILPRSLGTLINAMSRSSSGWRGRTC